MITGALALIEKSKRGRSNAVAQEQCFTLHRV
jgi:hypothetical protein